MDASHHRGTLMNAVLKQRVALFTNVCPGILIKEHTHLCLSVQTFEFQSPFTGLPLFYGGVYIYLKGSSINLIAQNEGSLDHFLCSLFLLLLIDTGSQRETCQGIF